MAQQQYDEPLTPEEYQELLNLGTANGNIASSIKTQQAQANHLRMSTLGGPRDYGRLSVAPSWMEMLGGLARNKVAQQKDDQSDLYGKVFNANQNRQNMLVLQGILADRLRKQQAIAPQGQTSPPPPGTTPPIVPWDQQNSGRGY